MIPVVTGTIDHSVEHYQDDDDLYHGTHDARDGGYSGAGLQDGHGGHVGHLRAAWEGQGEGVGGSTQDAQDEALGNVAVLEDGQGDGVHQDDDHTGNDAAHAQQGADDHDDAQGDDVLGGVAGVLSDELVHDGGGNGVGGAALPVETGLDAAEHEHEEETVDGGEDAVGVGLCDGGHEIAAGEQHDHAQAGEGGEVHGPVAVDQ